MGRKSSIDVTTLSIKPAAAPPARASVEDGPIRDALSTGAQNSVRVPENQVSPLVSKIRNTARALNVGARVVFTVTTDAGLEHRINQSQVDKDGTRPVTVYFRGKVQDVTS